MTVLDLLKISSWQRIEQILKIHYDDADDEELGKLHELYLRFRGVTIQKSIDEEEYLIVTALKVRDEDDEEGYVVDVFDENEEDLYFDVSLRKKGVEILYSIAASPHEEFLQYTIDEDTLKKFTPDSILAHALWELTAYGFEDNRP